VARKPAGNAKAPPMPVATAPGPVSMPPAPPIAPPSAIHGRSPTMVPMFAATREAIGASSVSTLSGSLPRAMSPDTEI
jgi:hypothetical protein